MRLRAHLSHCLYLNWALPRSVLPALPAPLSYQRHRHEDEDWVFATAVLFRQSQSHFVALPQLRWSFPQMTLRVCVLDEAGHPAVLCRRQLVPAWALLPSMLMRQPCEIGRLDFPRSDEPGPWEWQASRGGRFCCRAETASPTPLGVPDLGDWNDTVAYFRIRQRVYFAEGSSLKRMVLERLSTPAQPVAVDIRETELLEESFGMSPWPRLHSAFLCSDVPLEILVETVPSAGLAQQAPAPG